MSNTYDTHRRTRYAAASHIRNRGLDPSDCLIEATVRDDVVPSAASAYAVLPTERIIELIDRHKDTLAVVMLSGVQYVICYPHPSLTPL